MDLINKATIEELAKKHAAHSISLYIPTHRAGKEVISDSDRLRFKNQLLKAKKELKSYHLSDSEIDTYMAPLFDLHRNEEFWRHLSDGLAVFLSGDELRYFTLPVYFREHLYVSSELYLEPLLPVLNRNSTFFLLTLSLHEVKLYEATRHSIGSVYVADLLPEKLQDAAGKDFKERVLQFRSGQSGNKGGVYHGHNMAKDVKQEEIQKYFRAVDQGLMEVLHNENKPLVLAAVDYLVPIFKQISNYSDIYHRHISGNPEEEDIFLLHEKAVDVLEDHFDRELEQKKAQFQEMLSKQKASYKAEDIVPAAINGRIDTLFIADNTELWGKYFPDSNRIEVQNQKDINNVSLLNMAAIKTFLQDGQVFHVNPEDMPVKSSAIGALMRY